MTLTFTGVVLAGGYSRRMGRDKALICEYGQTRLERQAQVLIAAGASEVLISCRAEQRYEAFGYPIVFDEYQDMGPIGGVYSALSHARNPLVCILAVDLPNLPHDYLTKLLSQCRSGGGAVPFRGSYYEPLAAFYPQAASALVLNRILCGFYSLQALVEEGIKQQCLVSIPVVDHEELFFQNCNSPD